MYDLIRNTGKLLRFFNRKFLRLCFLPSETWTRIWDLDTPKNIGSGFSKYGSAHRKIRYIFTLQAHAPMQEHPASEVNKNCFS
jgi:hypothetical protein